MRTQTIRLVVFDMAGTTVKDRGNVAEAFIYALNKFNCPVPLEDINQLMGYKKTDAIYTLLEKFYPGKTANENGIVEKIHTAFQEAMEVFYQTDAALMAMEDAALVFSQLKEQQIKVALNTGFSRAIADIILERLGWKHSSLIDFTVASDEVRNGRPYPDMIYSLMKLSGVHDARDVVKVGDTVVDMLEGKMAGCGIVAGVTTGTCSRELLETAKADVVMDNLSELLLTLNIPILAKR